MLHVECYVKQVKYYVLTILSIQVLNILYMCVCMCMLNLCHLNIKINDTILQCIFVVHKASVFTLIVQMCCINEDFLYTKIIQVINKSE